VKKVQQEMKKPKWNKQGLKQRWKKAAKIDHSQAILTEVTLFIATLTNEYYKAEKVIS
jgi:hypothetical protein